MAVKYLETEALVVGAGPTGLMLAGELRLGGADVLVLDRLATPTGESRASQLNARTMEVFDQRGLLPMLGDVRRETVGHFGGVALDVSQVPSVHAGYWKIPQHRTERMLEAWATELGADIRRGHELLGLKFARDHVEVDVGTKVDPVQVRTRYVVGCDGERSTVRQLAGFDFAGTPSTQELIRADVRGIDIPPRRFHRFDNGLAIAGKTGDDVTRIMFHAFGHEARPRSEKPPFAEVVEAWAHITGEDISAGTPLWLDVFGNASRQATQYRKGRVLLAGDAAHQQMPTGGQALNLGLQDAVNLGWKLAGHIRGRAPAGLLGTYHAERHPVGARILANVQAQAHLLLGGPEVEATRAVFGELLDLDAAQSHLAIMLSGLDIRYPADPGEHPLAGARVPHCVLQTESGPSSTTALLHPADGVLLNLADDNGLPAAEADRVRIVAARAQPGGALSGIEAILLRPDGHVAWVDSAVTGLGSALSRWFGVPATSERISNRGVRK